ncbi:MAG: lipocalin family protein [Alphaproteobacteria bacterium]|nr:lipocalin family protein [Alphaproteobacteria bacterium]
MKLFRNLLFILTLSSCSTAVETNTIRDFQANKYLGKWYEIARFDNRFEKGLDNVSATYTKLKHNKIRVVNKGYNKEKKVWKEAKGVALLNKNPQIGKLRVSFFWPFFGNYNILYVNDEYTYAIIGSKSKKYLWLLSRNHSISEETKDILIKKVKSLGYDSNKLIYISHDLNIKNSEKK